MFWAGELGCWGGQFWLFCIFEGIVLVIHGDWRRIFGVIHKSIVAGALVARFWGALVLQKSYAFCCMK
ncbi:hypothetical protein CEW89_05875 [Celeribacter ethanolicus]|uniref:Uncharacterized protein n=1 Tax=Celeribacter ethanolicus TaxID=1758178 RepID=A0A291GAF3_9RHOB|nr:hypothetical protein CEW89_05875 [Celeribacter ethanolicus]